MLTRYSDWEAELDAFLRQRRSFAYGSIDCCLWSCDAIHTMTGTDPAAWFRGKYSSRAEATKLLKQFTGKPSVSAAVEKITREHAMPETTVLKARRGDIALIKRARDYSLGIVDLSGRIAVLTADGTIRIPLSAANRAWHV